MGQFLTPYCFCSAKVGLIFFSELAEENNAKKVSSKNGVELLREECSGFRRKVFFCIDECGFFHSRKEESSKKAFSKFS